MTMDMKEFAYNRKAHFEYTILETFEVGLVLHGFEVKSIKNGRVDLSDSYALIKNNEAYLLNCHIYPLQPLNTPANYRPDRTRKILITKQELKHITGKFQSERLTLVPIKLYNKGDFIKLSLALCKKTRKYEKREKIQKRDAEREIQRSLKTGDGGL
ncbi:MAG: SsrA-binding protein [Parcubacteria group bacterium GW2011_GWB1_46_8]|nr:MAG: SsrA-binding protein [Parcubacteria group bacterium GW2011_GWB1_46_8]